MGNRPCRTLLAFIRTARVGDHEDLGMADAEVIFSTCCGGRDNEEFLPAFAATDRAWNSVSAEAEGRQHWAEDVWMLGIGPLGAQQILDEIDARLAG
jgi:ABC-type Fe3+-hydroxamate transport system substrate-binding protein